MSGNEDLALSMVLSLQKLDNLTLAALNRVIQGLGTVDPMNMAFEPCKKLSLIREDGVPIDLESLRTASAYEVNRRVKAGTFV